MNLTGLGFFAGVLGTFGALLGCGSPCGSHGAPAELVQLAVPRPSAEVESSDPVARILESQESSPAWKQLLQDAQRVDFPRSSARAATAALDRGFLSGFERAAATYTLGAAGATAERDRLESSLEDPDVTVRAAAIFALAELPDPRSDVLIDLAQRSAGSPLSQATQLALVLADTVGTNVQIDSWLPEGGPRAERLTLYRALVDNPLSGGQGTAFELYQRLRWEAGKSYGLVDLQSWRALQLNERLTDDSFLDQAVLASVEGAATSAVGDHLISLLLERPSAGALRAAVRVLPAELNELLVFGLFDPTTPENWEALISEIERLGPTPEMVGILDRGLSVAGFQDRAAGLLLRLQTDEEREAGWELLEPLLASEDPADRLTCVTRLADSGDESWIEELERLEGDPDPGVLAGALVARVRLGDSVAERTVAQRLADPTGPTFEPLVRSLAAPLERHAGMRLMEELASSLEGELHLEVQLALARQGSPSARDAIRTQLDERTSGERTADCVRALQDGASIEDLARFAELFPAEEDLDLDLAVVQALVDGQAPLGRELLREALWRDDFDRGVLAGFAIVQTGGLNELWDELEVPPRGADAGDLRRLGYTLGLLGGVSQIERLARTRAASDPVVQGVYLGALSSRTR